MPTSPELDLDLPQLGPHALLDRESPDREPPGLGPPASVREAQEVECLRPAEAPPPSPSGGVPPELDQPRLLSLQPQRELGESLAQVGQELLGVLPILEAHDEVVRVAHDDHVTACLAAPPPLGPLVEG